MASRNIIVIGASAGGIDALVEIVNSLPADFPAAVFVVLHIPSARKSNLPEILSRSSTLPIAHGADSEAIEPGRIYVAPPGCHMLVKRDVIKLSYGPRSNGHRPAIDPLFRTAARSYGRRVIGIVLTGMLDDGTEGLAVIKKYGGICVVQSPEDAKFPDMPQSAIDNVEVDFAVPVTSIPALIKRLSAETVGETVPADELDLVEQKSDALEKNPIQGRLSAYTCPECNGTLWEVKDGELTRFQCHVGHAYSAIGLSQQKEEVVEAALWSAYRALEENASYKKRLAEIAHNRGHDKAQKFFLRQAKTISDEASVVRDVIGRMNAKSANQLE